MTMLRWDVNTNYQTQRLGPGVVEGWFPYDVVRHLHEELVRVRGAVDADATRLVSAYGKQLRAILPAEPIRELVEFGAHRGPDVLILRNLMPYEVAPPTPYDGAWTDEDEEHLWPFVGLQLGLFDLMNLTPIAYANENGRRLLRHVTPAVRAQGEKSSHGSVKAFLGHVDNPDRGFFVAANGRSPMPQFLAFVGVRGDPEVATEIVPLDRLVERLPLAVVRNLQRPEYTVYAPDSNATGRERYALKDVPLLVEDPKLGFVSRIDLENCVGLTREAKAALRAVRSQLAAKDIAYAVNVQAGDFLAFVNPRAIHFRSSFMPRGNGLDRHLIRMYGTTDLARGIPAGIPGRPSVWK